MAERNEWTLDIGGMTCDHCARTIDATLRRLPGVFESRTAYPEGRSHVIAEPLVGPEALAAAIAPKYRVTGHSSRPLRSESGVAYGEVDLAIVGGGSAAFAAAIRAADLGAKAVIIERGALGGTCVNVGCVPSKTLIRAAEAVHRAGHPAFAGIRAQVERPDFGAVVKQKDALVAELQKAKYWDVLATYPSVKLVQGNARFLSDGMLEVNSEPLRARKILLAMGAHPWAPPIPGLAETPHLTSTEALALTELPRSLVVVGGSAVGLELAQLFARIGAKVTVLEALPRIVPSEDAEVSDALAGYLREEGMEIHSSVAVQRVSGNAGAYRVKVEEGGRAVTFEAEQLLVATGRRPNTSGVGLEEAGIRLGRKGEVVVDGHLETSRPGIYAAGDVIGDPAFVYVAAYAGSLAAENALQGNARRYDLGVLPRVTFTDPAVASVGLTEAQAREQRIAVAVSKLPLAYVPRSIAARDTRGFIKLVADEKTNLLVGAHILAAEAGDIIQQPAMAIRFGIRIDELAAMLHPYLTLSEGIKLASQTFKKDVAKLSCCAV